uniref:Association with the SNF1 complex (ASC) domain-containing protein n=1 Tax=Polytomella parva TaxID=51329 RepID=A0A7S0VGY9_9CHLO|mmetsp:Transcript_35036/g.63029  ORF Transcript_35036/g.63029 Transcript_35036/m.63029 type:complete len:317 (+) Transcript_35036:83-1033(+)|eukprot:CAMPEP_0175055832 /NCGR_PEP_ID=MMETSP0052_2-20121109/10309_1 /TAXON_ID=51329 ORGANISM="Polytomella parva, Strain SAG 63-3" /NCGR_SAMPLE_ID=MMETSP0052_2 /ASSEMBLY_ACC=CAM_ASM_000194 /LENGTH=316 /DNA_ID=CAMNT_0016320741 /DNA_START=73 /DNA_END=1023 /DNA_ORIENTATION=+
MGNTTSTKIGPPAIAEETYNGDKYRASPPLSPGSPLTYSPQVPMEPLARLDEANRAQISEYQGLSAWPAQPKLMPVVFVWSHGGNHVEVEGSFDNWTTRQPLQRSGKDFTTIKLLPPGVYQYKFIVDNEWKYDPNQPAMFDDMRNVNNVIEVHEYVPENLEGVSGFDPPPSPPSSYHCPSPSAEDYAKEPPSLPPHLQLTLLNVNPSTISTQAMLPRPQHVVLNHIYCQRGQSYGSSSSSQAVVVGTTSRYKSKYVTCVVYKPRKGSNINSGIGSISSGIGNIPNSGASGGGSSTSSTHASKRVATDAAIPIPSRS